MIASTQNHHARSRIGIGKNAGSQVAKSIELRKPVAGWIFVVYFLFSRQRLLCNKKTTTSRPLAFVSTQPHRLLWALKVSNK